MTSLAEEQAIQRRWRLRPEFAHLDYFDRLVAHEFVAFDQQAAWRDQQLAQTIAFAVEHVPYYRGLFGRLSLSAEDVTCLADLTKLPVLTKHDVQQNETALQPESLPPGETLHGWTSSSGTTGRPTRVIMTKSSNNMFGYLAQRGARWAGWWPDRKLAVIRVASTLPRLADGSVLPVGETLRGDHWPYGGRHFLTGPVVTICRNTPVAQQIEWLRRERPSYLVTYPNALEALAIAHPDGPPTDSIEGVYSISAQLTAAVRARVERALGVTVGQDYGLNEIGIVACRCDAGRYHIHAEHCLTEIVHDDGRPCAPGETGKLLVTGLRNLAMPLVRYDTGDVAEAVEGPCACGRTLPSFGRILGRYRSWNDAPPGTAARLQLVTGTIQGMDAALIKPVRQYQLHQDRRDTFELRVIADGKLPQAFTDTVLNAWRQEQTDPPDLVIRQVEHIAPPPGGKHQEFTSDFFPHPHAE